MIVVTNRKQYRKLVTPVISQRLPYVVHAVRQNQSVQYQLFRLHVAESKVVGNDGRSDGYCPA